MLAIIANVSVTGTIGILGSFVVLALNAYTLNRSSLRTVDLGLNLREGPTAAEHV